MSAPEVSSFLVLGLVAVAMVRGWGLGTRGWGVGGAGILGRHGGLARGSPQPFGRKPFYDRWLGVAVQAKHSGVALHHALGVSGLLVARSGTLDGSVLA